MNSILIIKIKQSLDYGVKELENGTSNGLDMNYTLSFR